jgi:hypothetical protein
MTVKREFIDAYFERWRTDLAKAKELLDTQHFHLEGWLVLSCHIGAFAAMRFPDSRDGEAYVQLVLEYSGRRQFYEQIDLLFLYQWPRSKLCNHGTCKALKQHAEIVAALVAIYGSEHELKAALHGIQWDGALAGERSSLPQ